MITAGTYLKQRFFHDETRLELLQGHLLSASADHGWTPHAWACFPNHYHFIGIAPNEPRAVQRLTSRIHTLSARDLNRLDGKEGRKVGFNCWDTLITFEKSVLARIAYVHYNPVRHGVVVKAEDYQCCSARWFLRHGDKSFVASGLAFKTDRVNVVDDF